MMTKQKKPRLNRDPNYRDLDNELRINGKSLLLLFFFVLMFILLAFIAVPQTYGWF